MEKGREKVKKEQEKVFSTYNRTLKKRIIKTNLPLH